MWAKLPKLLKPLVKVATIFLGARGGYLQMTWGAAAWFAAWLIWVYVVWYKGSRQDPRVASGPDAV